MRHLVPLYIIIVMCRFISHLATLSGYQELALLFIGIVSFSVGSIIESVHQDNYSEFIKNRIIYFIKTSDSHASLCSRIINFLEK